MKTALEILDMPPYHGFTIFANPPDAKAWTEALDAKSDNNPLHAHSSRGTSAPLVLRYVFTRHDWDSQPTGPRLRRIRCPSFPGPRSSQHTPRQKSCGTRSRGVKSYDNAAMSTRFNAVHAAASYRYRSWRGEAAAAGYAGSDACVVRWREESNVGGGKAHALRGKVWQDCCLRVFVRRCMYGWVVVLVVVVAIAMWKI